MHKRRGIGWSFGIKGNQIPPPHDSKYFLPKLLRRLAFTQIASMSAYTIMQYSRQFSPDRPSAFLLHAFDVYDQAQNTFFGAVVEHLSRVLLTCAFGVGLIGSMEVHGCWLPATGYIFTNSLRAIIPSKSALAAYIRPDPFNYKAWPKIQRRPLLSQSITEFWGKRWHALFRRTFTATGARPALKLANSLGVHNKSVKLAFSACGAFLVSAIIHESCELTFHVPFLKALHRFLALALAPNEVPG